MDSTTHDEEIRLCEQDIREAEGKILMARLRIAHLRGEGPWHSAPALGVEQVGDGGARVDVPADLVHAAVLAEREACAKVAEEWDAEGDSRAKAIAIAIRARE